MQTEVAFQSLPVASLRDSATNPRRHIDEAKLRELADSIKAQGVLEPLLVRPLNGKGKPYEVVAGHRRFRASQLAGLVEIPCLVRDLTDGEALEIQVIENLQREDVHPLDEALGYKRLLELDGHDVTWLADRVGKSASYVYQRLKLTEMIEPAQKAFLDDKLQFGHARELARLTEEQQQRALRAMNLVGKPDDEDFDDFYNDRHPWSAARLRTWIEQTFHFDLHSAPFKKDDAELVPVAGPCTTCPKRTGANPLLFDDVKKGDTCTDPVCFNGKIAAHVERRQTELAAKHDNLVKISTSYGFYSQEGKKLAADGVLPASRYTEAKKSDPGAVPAVIIDADSERGKLGKLVYVKPKGAERNGGGSDYNPRTGLSKAEDQKRRLEKLIAQRTVSAIVAAAPTTLNQRLVRTVILPRLCEEANPHSKTERAFWTEQIGVDRDDVAFEDVDLTPAQISKVVLLATLWDAVFGYSVDEAALTTACECVGVDPKAIATAVRAEFKAKSDKKAGSAKKTAKKGGKR